MKQVAVGIILKDGHVLACQRKHDARYPLKWEFPGGKLEDGETGVQAVIRELQEELQITATVDRELHRQEWIYSDGTADSREDGAFRVFYFLIRTFSGTPMNRAFEQIRWVKPRDLTSMDILEGNRKAVDILVRNENRIFGTTDRVI